MDRHDDVLTGWTRLGTVAPGELVDDRMQLHHAVQLLSAFGQTYLDARPDDSHRSMGWDPRRQSFATDPTPSGAQLVLQVPGFRVSLWKDGREVSAMPLKGATLNEAKAWLDRTAKEVGAGERTALGWPEYHIPGHPVAGDTPFSPTVEGLLELSKWYSDAWLLLDALKKVTPGASPIRCWPHHFDLATLITVAPATESGDARTTGVGLSPGDEGSSEPYLYVNLWPYPDPDQLPTIDGPGRWNQEGWVGAILHAEALVGAGGEGAQARMSQRFVQQRVNVAQTLLGSL